MTLRNRFSLSSSFSTFYFDFSPHTHYIGTVCRACQMLCDMLSMAAYLACLWNWPWCSNDVVRRAGYTNDRQRQGEKTESQGEEGYFLRGILIWSSLPPLLQLQLLSSDSLWRKRLSDKDRREDRGWKGVEEMQKKKQIKGMTAPQQYSLFHMFSTIQRWHREQINNIYTQSLKWCGSQALHYNHKCASCSRAL